MKNNFQINPSSRTNLPIFPINLSLREIMLKAKKEEWYTILITSTEEYQREYEK